MIIKIQEVSKNRVRKAKPNLLSWPPMGKNKITEETKMQFCRTVFLSTLVYGIGSITVLEKHKRRLQVNDMRYLMRAAEGLERPN